MWPFFSHLVIQAELSIGGRRQLWVMCRLAEEAAVTAGVPQIADDFIASRESAEVGQIWTWQSMQLAWNSSVGIRVDTDDGIADVANSALTGRHLPAARENSHLFDLSARVQHLLSA